MCISENGFKANYLHWKTMYVSFTEIIYENDVFCIKVLTFNAINIP